MSTRLPIAAFVAALLSLPSAAGAETICVDPAPCDAGTEVDTLQQALDLAAANLEPDVVRVGGGLQPQMGPFEYDSEELLEIVGASAGATILTASGSGAVLAVETLPNRVVIRDLTVRVPDVEDAIGLRLVGARASGVTVRHTGPQASKPTGVVLGDHSSFEDGRVTMDQGVAVETVQDAGGTQEVRRSTLEGAPVVVGRSPITRIQRSTLDTWATAVFAHGAAAGVSVKDSLIRGTGPSFVGLWATRGAALDGVRLTIAGDAGGTGALARHDEGQPGGRIMLWSSIVHGVAQSLVRRGTAFAAANLTVKYSAYDPATLVSTGPGVLNADTTNLPAVDPGFAETEQFTLRADSALVDRVDLVLPGGLDLAGLPRGRDGDGNGFGRSDIGAHEFQPTTPTAAFDAPEAIVAGAEATFDALGSTIPTRATSSRTRGRSATVRQAPERSRPTCSPLPGSAR